MAGPESAEEETRVVLDRGAERLVLMAYELFALIGPDFEGGVRADMLKGFDEPRPSAARIVLPVPNLQTVEIVPSKLDTAREAILAEAMYVGNPDGTVQYLAFYLNPEAAKKDCAALAGGTGITAGKGAGAADAPVCRALARRIATTLALGTRQLSLRGGERRLDARLGGAKLVLRLPAGVVITTQDGPDFTVFRLSQLGPIGTPAGSLGIYVGGNPGYQHRQQSAAAPIERVPGRALGQPVEWQSWSPRPGRITAEIIMPVPGHEGQQLHLFAGGAPGAELEAMKQIAADLRVEPGVGAR
jgi:hypothetical protein